MKKFFLAGIALCFLSCSKDQLSGNTHITGEIKGLKQGTLYIQQVKDSTLVTLDSIVLKGKSTFESSFDLEEPEVLYLGLNRGTTSTMDNLILFFAEPGNLKINSELENFSGSAQVEGSKNQELYNKYLKSKSLMTNKQNILIKEALLARMGKLSSKADSLDRVVKRTSGRIYLNAVNFALKNNNHEVAPYIALTDVATVNSKYLDTIYGNLSPEVAKSKYGSILKNYLELIKQ